MLSAAGLACGDAVQPEPPPLCLEGVVDEAIVTIAWTSRPDTMDVLVRGSNAVRRACDFIAGRNSANIPSGRIVVGSAPSDPRVPFHYIPESVQFVEAAIELCDSALLRTDEAVVAFFQGTSSDLNDSAPYCPWGARPVYVREAG